MLKDYRTGRFMKVPRTRSKRAKMFKNAIIISLGWSRTLLHEAGYVERYRLAGGYCVMVRGDR